MVKVDSLTTNAGEREGGERERGREREREYKREYK